MAASAGTILKEYKEEIDKITARHEHALGYAPGMDQMELDDWERLNDMVKTVRSTYSELSEKYAWQYGLTAEELSEIGTKCYDEVEKGGKLTIHTGDVLGCKKREALLLKAQKGMPL